ncbi:glycosyltransferase family 4 protein [Bauldia litoralis]|uniref:Glycosyltransferase involved in cell wall bisynthesis n=1 Tax=Bauldia litoralis TaxID=665467 RepID=A0A1G6EB18_9HYPH|nr:glycosyltransferase family 4 protein [Bauldia litoralis]SDB54125.1 Glycosyltransferase involved in cell wall bisynthesis [Bauldia litoralis]
MRVRVCIVTGELAGPDFNGGIGTSNRGLSLALAAAGYEVDVLYTRVNDGRPFCTSGPFEQQVRSFARGDVTLRCIPHGGRWNEWLSKSYLVYRHLSRHRYDVVFFDDMHGNGYMTLLAKRAGAPELEYTTFCVVAHSATQWIFDANNMSVSGLAEVTQMEMERRSIELADLLITPSSYIVSRYREFGWSIPEAVVVQPNILPRFTHRSQAIRHVEPREFVFFGRLEKRKGLWLFCAALDRLKKELTGRTVTFLGKTTEEYGVSTGTRLLGHIASWPFDVRMLTSYDSEQALSYLAADNRVAVMPSPEDNSPSVVLECLHNGIPFVASKGSGGEELIAEASRANSLFEPTVEGLTDKLRDALANGVSASEAVWSADQVKDSYLKLVEKVASGAFLKKRTGPDAVCPACIILVIAEPEGLGSLATDVALLRRNHPANTEFWLLVPPPDDLAFSGEVPSGEDIRIFRYDQYADLCSQLASRDGDIVGVCHASQPLSPNSVNVATRALQSMQEPVAVTGLIVDLDERETDVFAEPYFSTGDGRRISDPVLGNAAAVFLLKQATNSGFVFVRAPFFSILATTSPVDPVHGRIKLMEVWIHELLMVLRLYGESFELAPDLTEEKRVRQRPFEVHVLAGLLRSLIPSELEFEPGTDQALLSRLGIEGSMERLRPSSKDELPARLREMHWSVSAPSPQLAKQLSVLAVEIGQIQASAELLAPQFGSCAQADELSDIVGLLEKKAREIDLVTLVATGTCEWINLEHDWSFALDAVEGWFEMHANAANEGRAGLAFRRINLEAVRSFHARVELPARANPVRCRLELMTASRDARIERVALLTGGSAGEIELEVPPELQRDCEAFLSVEMLNQLDSSEGARVRWSAPAFKVTESNPT